MRDLAAKVGRVGKRAVNKILQQAQEKARKEENEHRDRSSPGEGGKPIDTRQRLDLRSGDRPAQLSEIEAALRNPANIEAGSVLGRGQAQAVLRFAADPVRMGGGRAEIELPTGSAYLAPARPEHLQAQLDRLFAFYKFGADGKSYPIDCPADLARYVLLNASLLPVNRSVGRRFSGLMAACLRSRATTWRQAFSTRQTLHFRRSRPTSRRKMRRRRWKGCADH